VDQAEQQFAQRDPGQGAGGQVRQSITGGIGGSMETFRVYRPSTFLQKSLDLEASTQR
jgi:hypothetical protein